MSEITIVDHKRTGVSQKRPLKFYVALRGIHSPKECIRIGQLIEELGFDRVYVYDDLMYRPSWPALALMAEHTTRLELGPCVVNGFYTHPAMIAENAVFLDEISEQRAVIGIGRGAFFDFLNMDNAEPRTRIGCEETIQLVKRFLKKNNSPFQGQYFEANEKAVLRWDPPRADIPIVMGSWNEKMAFIAGKHCHELQVAEVWNLQYLEQLYLQLMSGADTLESPEISPILTIGGMSCISLNEKDAYERAKRTMAVYLPYLKGVMSKSGFDVNTDRIKNIEYYSKLGRYEEASNYITDQMVKTLSLSGTPEIVIEKTEYLLSNLNIQGILFSPPYGTGKTIEENLELIVHQVISKLKPKFKQERTDVKAGKTAPVGSI